MKFKIVLSSLLAALVCISCSKSDTPKEKQFRIGFAMTLNDPYWQNMRLGALQDWPEFDIMFMTPPATNLARSASGNKILADLPPNSCDTRLTVSAADLATMIPALSIR